jgi:MtrB/PioB family decaheme-associated outer membrane protein
MHQLTGLVTYALSPINRLTALASVSRLTQDDKFLPYSVYDTVDSLPVNSLDGEVWLYRGQVKYDSRPTRKLRLSAKYTYDERDNDIDQNSYDYVIADTISAGEVVGTPFPVTNNPLSYTRNKVNLDANYYFNSMFSLRADYQYLDVHRSYDDNVRKNTRENTLNARLRMRANSELNVDFYGGVSRRSGSQYYTRLNENPDLRVFYMADVDREEVGINITYTPLDPLTFSLKTDYWNNDYDKTEIGLKQSTQRAATFDASYRFNENLSTHMFYSYEESDTNQAGENPEAEKGTLDVWDTEMTDQIQSFGLGFNLTALDKWDGGLDWVYTRSRGVIDGYGYTAPIDLDSNITGPFTPIEVQPFPDLRTSLSSLQLWAKYHYSEKIAYKLSYWYESYQTDNWGIDDLTNDSVKQYLLLGQSELDYNQNVLGVSVIMQF